MIILMIFIRRRNDHSKILKARSILKHYDTIREEQRRVDNDGVIMFEISARETASRKTYTYSEIKRLLNITLPPWLLDNETLAPDVKWEAAIQNTIIAGPIFYDLARWI